MKYTTFIRSARDFEEFASARKTVVDTDLSLDEARRACSRYNKDRTPQQRNKGTKMEYTSGGVR